jgi:hypothetical protein
MLWLFITEHKCIWRETQSMLRTVVVALVIFPLILFTGNTGANEYANCH